MSKLPSQLRAYAKAFRAEAVYQHLPDCLEQSADEIECLRAEVERLKAAAVPEGWKLVPVVPKDEMVAAAIGLVDEYAAMNSAEAVYKVMIAAAPQPPTASVQACRPEDRAILKTDAGREMVAAAVAAMEKPAERTEC